MTKCLVLGANGFIGSHLADELAANQHHVRAFGRFTTTESHRFLAHNNIEVMRGDFLNRHDLHNAVDGMDYVFHFISTTTPVSADDDPHIDAETNIRMGIELFEACVAHKVKKVIFASSGGAIYGETKQEIPIAENVNPQPVSPYAIGKLTIEHYLRYYQKKHGLDSVTFRISNAYGERYSLLSRQGVIPIFLHHILQDKPITIFGDGTMVRDYIYVKDLAKLIVHAYQYATQPVYNLGSGKGISLHELLDTIKKITQKPVKIHNVSKPATFIEKIILDNKLYTQEFNMLPTTCLETGIQKTWEYMLSRQVALPHNT